MPKYEIYLHKGVSEVLEIPFHTKQGWGIWRGGWLLTRIFKLVSNKREPRIQQKKSSKNPYEHFALPHNGIHRKGRIVIE